MSGNYWTNREGIGNGTTYMNVYLEWRRPTSQPIVGDQKMRFGFWVESDGSESMSCGWSYTPFNDRSFTCISFRDDYPIEEKHDKWTFHNFSNINSR